MVQEHFGEYQSLWAAIESIALQTLHEWARKQEVDTGLRAGITSEDATASNLWSNGSRNCAGPTKF
jgi:hypothetical protein